MLEELFKDSEQFIETDHPRILKAKKGLNPDPEFFLHLDELEKLALSHNSEEVSFYLQKLLPEFTPYVYLDQSGMLVEKKNCPVFPFATC